MAIYRYDNIEQGRNKKNKRVLKTSTPPNLRKNPDDIYIYTREGDRLDLLASQYYNDRTKWVYIAAANNLHDLVCEPGIQLRIPSDSDVITDEWLQQNNER